MIMYWNNELTITMNTNTAATIAILNHLITGVRCQESVCHGLSIFRSHVTAIDFVTYNKLDSVDWPDCLGSILPIQT